MQRSLKWIEFTQVHREELAWRDGRNHPAVRVGGGHGGGGARPEGGDGDGAGRAAAGERRRGVRRGGCRRL